MKRLYKTSLGILFLASLGGVIADAHVFFPSYQEYIAAFGILGGLILSVVGLVLIINEKESK